VTPSATEHFSSSVRRPAAADVLSEPRRRHAKDFAAELAPKSGIAGADRVLARKAPGAAPNMVDPERAVGFPRSSDNLMLGLDVKSQGSQFDAFAGQHIRRSGRVFQG